MPNSLHMDTQFHSNNMNSSTANYSSLPSISPHQLQQQNQMPTHILPPLQPAPHSSMQPMYSNSAPMTPRTHTSPNTPTSGGSMNFPQMCQTSPRFQVMTSNNSNLHPRSYQMISSGNDQGYRPITTVVPHTSNATQMSYSQVSSSVPQNRMPPQAMRPMSHNGMHNMQGGMPSPYAPNNMLQMVDMKSPTHVVGSQGRRGILPSAPGRPPVNSNTAKSGLIATKDADGKFPCPHCTKTYLHAKHLKRHLLRHTGDRPYMCILCRDTFSRSDILKRHFQKCSIRRGNPTGASHLSHSQAHVKKAQLSTSKNINERIAEVNSSMAPPNEVIPMYRVAPDGAVPEQYSAACVSSMS